MKRMNQPESWDVVVVGSANYDHTVRAPRLPRAGETLLGGPSFSGAGGKGANQALAAAAFGSRTALLCRVGPDSAGLRLIEGLEEHGVTCPLPPGHGPTGMALIVVTTKGENSIVVAPGANSELKPSDVDLSQHARVVLAQLEVPVATVAAAASSARLFVLNPAPAQPLPPDLMRQIDFLVPNRSELATLLGSDEPQTVSQAATLGRRLSSGGPTVVATLGPDGALLCQDSAVWHIPAPAVEVVDTTGAGDCFCGVLAASLAANLDPISAVKHAVAAGSLATTTLGAAAIPDPVKVSALVAAMGSPTLLQLSTFTPG